MSPFRRTLSKPRLCVYFEVLCTKAASGGFRSQRRLTTFIHPKQSSCWRSGSVVLAQITFPNEPSFTLIMACRGRFTSRAFHSALNIHECSQASSISEADESLFIGCYSLPLSSVGGRVAGRPNDGRFLCWTTALGYCTLQVISLGFVGMEWRVSEAEAREEAWVHLPPPKPFSAETIKLLGAFWPK